MHQNYPSGFRKRRVQNWVILGLMYSAYYLSRYNFRAATPFLVDEFHFSKTDISSLWAAFSFAYGTGQLINGLFSDRIGGKNAMLIGGFGTLIVNLICGFSPMISSFTTFSSILLLNGYFQSWGAPGMVKINAAWFMRSERGTFSGVFGFMVQLGQILSAQLSPLLLAGFAIGTFVVAENDWRWLFRVPPIIVSVMMILTALFVKESPELAGYDPKVIIDEIDDTNGVRVSLKESFKTIFSHPLIWYYSLAYACTGATRHSVDQLATLFFVEKLSVDPQGNGTLKWIFTLMPFVSVLGSFAAGWISDKMFSGHRGPVASRLYFLAAVVMIAGAIILPMFSGSLILSGAVLLMVALPINATHSIIGSAAPMDIGGKKMAGFAAGVIDSFQYYGAAIAMPFVGRMIDWYGWNAWLPSMSIFCVFGGIAMLKLTAVKENLRKLGVKTTG